MGLVKKALKLGVTALNPVKLAKKGLTAIRQDWQSVTGQSAARRAQEAAAIAQKDALAQQAEIAAVQAKQQQSLQNMQANAQVDLRADNLTTVVAGGTADLLATDDTAARKRRQGGGLASSLGLNV